ncbi:FAD/NAD(P)-binding domain-containing protein [Hymenopellis radicata]|nr:FAD/NAD(P)-binding domain-containing protein [Hymenopellis radicata]
MFVKLEERPLVEGYPTHWVIKSRCAQRKYDGSVVGPTSGSAVITESLRISIITRHERRKVVHPAPLSFAFVPTMPGIPGFHNRPKQTALPIDFVIVGGGITGFSTAIALRRVGHRVLVLEKDEDVNQMPPNLSKILYHWGLTDEVRAIGEVSGALKFTCVRRVFFLSYPNNTTAAVEETGELLGSHFWDEEVLRETRGEFVFAHINDLRRLFYETALVVGAEIRLGSTVETVDTEAVTVTLSDGTVLQGDVILGCDGLHGVTRQILMEANEEEEGAPTIDLSMYSVTVPKSLILNDPLLGHVYETDTPTLLNWFGNQHAVLGFPLGGKSPSFGMYVYGPRDPAEGTWNDCAPVSGLSIMLQYSEPKLQRLGELVSEATCACVSVDGRPPLEEWVDNPVHAMPPGSIQDCALTVEDGAVLAKLFSHLHSKDQIQSFLYAFQDLRQPRCASVYAKEACIVQYMVVPPGDFQQMRDDSMRAKRDAGVGILEAVGDLEESPEWIEIKEVFGYDAEDDADNWWVEWGLLRERARVNADIGTHNALMTDVMV